MFPPAREVLEAHEGSLSATPLPLLLHAVFLEGRTLVLELRRHQLLKRIVFEEGYPVGCESNLLPDTFGRFLVERGRLTETACHEALAFAAREGMPLGEALVLRGHLQPYDLFRLLQQNLARKLLDCFTWSDARYRLVETQQPVDTPLRTNPAQLILTGAASWLPFEVVAQSLTFFDAQRFARVERPPHPVEALKLQPRDARLLTLLQRRPTFAELCAASQLSGEEVLRRLYAFGVLGIVAFAEEGATEARPGVLPPAPVASEPAVAEPTAPPVPGEDAERVNDVLERFLKHRTQDPFDLLGVPPTVSVAELRAAYLAFAERYRPALFTGSLATVADKAEELFLAGARAYALLADGEARTVAIERRARRAEERKRPKGEAGAAFRIQTSLLDADEQFREGLRLLEQGAHAAAEQSFEFACDIAPSKALFRAHLGWTRFLVNPGRPERALAELAKALERDPRCDLAHFFEGQIRERSGDAAAAEACFRKAIKARPDERRYTEALKALLAAQKRRA